GVFTRTGPEFPARPARTEIREGRATNQFLPTVVGSTPRFAGSPVRECDLAFALRRQRLANLFSHRRSTGTAAARAPLDGGAPGGPRLFPGHGDPHASGSAFHRSGRPGTPAHTRPERPQRRSALDGRPERDHRG